VGSSSSGPGSAPLITARSGLPGRSVLHRECSSGGVATHPGGDRVAAGRIFSEYWRGIRATRSSTSPIDRKTVRGTRGPERPLWILATSRAVAPFIGFFGTVIGIIKAFHNIGAHGQRRLLRVAAGISRRWWPPPSSGCRDRCGHLLQLLPDQDRTDRGGDDDCLQSSDRLDPPREARKWHWVA